MPRGDGAGPMGSGPMTGRRMGSCAGPGSGGQFLGSGRGLGLLGLGMWLIRLWSARRQDADLDSRAKHSEAADLRKKIAEMEGTISELKQQLGRVEEDRK